METETTGTIALIALILVILVILYLFLGRLISNMYPNSKANKFFGGTAPTRNCDIITDKLLEIHDTKYGDERHNDLHNYMQTLTQENGGDIMYAIVQMADINNNNVNNRIDLNYIVDVLNTAERANIIDPQSPAAQELHDAINNSSDGRIDIPERLRSIINQIINGRPARSYAQGSPLRRTDNNGSMFQ